MTPEDHAWEVCKALTALACTAQEIETIAEHIRQAVAAERARCLRCVDDVANQWLEELGTCLDDVKRAITVGVSPPD